MLSGQELELTEILEEYDGRVVVLGSRGLRTAGPFLTAIQTPGGQVNIYHHPRNGFPKITEIGVFPVSNKPTMLKAFEFGTGEPLLDPAYTIMTHASSLPLGEIFGYRPDLALAEHLGIPNLKGQHEAMITRGIVSRIKRELGL